MVTSGSKAKQAEKVLQKAGEPMPPGTVPVNLQELMARIGSLTVERDYWQTQTQLVAAEVGRLKELYEPKEEDETKEPTLASKERPA